MTSTIPQDVTREVSELHTSAKAQLVRAITALNRLEARVDAGEVGQKSEATKILGDIRDWLKIAHEMEMRLEKQNHDSGKDIRDHALDLGEARTTIGCRLDRLRRSGCPGCVPR
jgi:hypothetical protein